MKFPRLALLFALALAAMTPSARPAPAKAPDAKAIVAEWVGRIRAGGAVYPGGRQRDLLERHFKAVLPHLVEAFADEDHRVGRILLEVAALAPVEPGQKILWAALEDERPFVREFTALALGRMGAADAIPMIVTAFRRGLLSRESTTGTLVTIDGDAGEQALVAMLTSYEAKTRTAAVAALGAFATRGSRKALVKTLRDKEPEVRAAALAALGKAGGPDEVGAVIARLRDKSDAVRLAAVLALGSLRGEKARTALVRHFNAERGERLEALEAAVAAGEPVGSVATVFVTRVLAEEDAGRRCRAARLLARSEQPEAEETLRSALEKEDDASIAFEIATVFTLRGGPSFVPLLRGLLDRFPDHSARALDLLDRAGDAELPDRLRATERVSDEPAGGALARLVLHADPEDVQRALDAARERPNDPGLLADAYLLVAAVGGKDTIDMLVRGAQRLPDVDRIVVPEGPVRPGIRAVHMYVLRALTGRAFGYDPSRPDPEIRNAMRRALKWWITTGRKAPDDDVADALAAAKDLLASKTPYRREAALRVLARADRHEELHEVMTTDPAPAVRIRAAGHLVEASDPRAVTWLIEHFASEDLVDWTPFIESPRPTRLEAARTLWRATNRRLAYRGGPLEEEWCRDLVLEDTRRWRAWWAAEGGRGPAAWFEEGCRRQGIVLGEGEDALRTLAGLLGDAHPRFLKQNALARLRKLTGERILRVSIPDLEVLAPGEDHPIFRALAWRWMARVDSE